MGDTTNGEPDSNLPQVNHVSVRPPPFYRENACTWFAQLEAQFILNRITSTTTKYYHCLAYLPEDVASLIDIAISPDYDCLKTQVVSAFGKSRSLKLEEALVSLNIQGVKPSIALQKLRRSFHDAGISPEEDILKHRLLRSFPSSMLTTMAAHQSRPAAEFACIADTVWEVLDSNSHVFAASAHSLSPLQPDRPPRDGSLSSLPFIPGQQPKICRSHLYYAHAARWCKPWCLWPGPKPRTMEPSSRLHSRSSSPRHPVSSSEN